MMETPDQTVESAAENNPDIPSTSEMQAPTSRRAKDPNKVKAGLKSAEKRKAKQKEAEQKQMDLEQRLAQLESLKSRMREERPEAEHLHSKPPPHVPDVPSSITVTPTGRQESVARQNSDGASSVRDWTPWVLGGLGLAAIAWQVMKPKLDGTSKALKVPGGTSSSNSIPATRNLL